MAMINFFKNLYDLVFPPLCVVCGDALQRHEDCLCINCLVEMPRTRLHTDPENHTSQLFWGRVPFVRATALFFYNKNSAYRQCLYELKYKNHAEVGFFLGRELGRELCECAFLDDVDVLIPLPLHPRRLRERGYNQSSAICEGIERVSKVPCENSAVIRTRYTSTQTKRNRVERLENMQDAFLVPNTSLLANKHVLLVDDVITTGASIEACCNALLKVPDIKISIVSLGITKN